MSKNLLKQIVTVIIKFYIIIVGFSFCQNIITPLSIGSTPFNVLLFLLIPLVFYLFFSSKKGILIYLNKLPATYCAFLLIILFSFIPALIIAPKVGGILPAVKGLIYYLISCVCPVVLGILLKKEHLKYLMIGFFIGFISNALMSIIVYFAFNVFGYTLTLSQLFINESFFVPNYFSSAQGLFLEPSHMAGYMLVMIYVLLWYFKDKIVRSIIIVLAWVCFIMYGMGNLPIFILSQIIVFIHYFRRKIMCFIKEKIFISKIKIVLFCVIVLLVVIGSVFLCIGPFKTKIISVFDEANIFSKNNQERYLSTMVGLQLFLSYPFGVGFNMSGTAISVFYSDVLNTYTTHSYLITLLAELGFIGTITFIIFCVLLFKKALRIKDGFLIGIGFLFGIVFAFLDGRNEPYIYITIGIILSQTNINTLKAIKRLIKQKRLSSEEEYYEITV